MKTTITIEVETEGFLPLYTMIDPKTKLPIEEGEDTSDAEEELAYTEEQFHTEIKDEIESMFDTNIPENIIQDKFPEQWEYLEDCCHKLSLKINGKEIKGWLLHRDHNK